MVVGYTYMCVLCQQVSFFPRNYTTMYWCITNAFSGVLLIVLLLYSNMFKVFCYSDIVSVMVVSRQRGPIITNIFRIEFIYYKPTTTIVVDQRSFYNHQCKCVALHCQRILVFFSDILNYSKVILSHLTWTSFVSCSVQRRQLIWPCSRRK